jgi:hypothetical protein
LSRHAQLQADNSVPRVDDALRVCVPEIQMRHLEFDLERMLG